MQAMNKCIFNSFTWRGTLENTYRSVILQVPCRLKPIAHPQAASKLFNKSLQFFSQPFSHLNGCWGASQFGDQAQYRVSEAVLWSAALWINLQLGPWLWYTVLQSCIHSMKILPDHMCKYHLLNFVSNCIISHYFDWALIASLDVYPGIADQVHIFCWTGRASELMHQMQGILLPM